MRLRRPGGTSSPGRPGAAWTAFLRIRSAGASRGIVLHLTWANPETLRRRELASPDVKHVGPESIQRMADAVVVGADPLGFVLGPAVLD